MSNRSGAGQLGADTNQTVNSTDGSRDGGFTDCLMATCRA